MNDRLDNALWLLMDHDIARYLIVNTSGRLNGGAKAMHHLKLCTIYIAVQKCCSIEYVEYEFYDLVQKIHIATTSLTSYMDEKIGFPIDDSRPDYDILEGKFFKEFIILANEEWNKVK
jgi:hypothetical protein